MPYTLMGIGGAMVTTAIIMEMVNAGDGDDFETAHGACVNGDGSQCPVANELADDISGQQGATITLVSLGLVTAGAGAAWWWFVNAEEESTDTAIALLPVVHNSGFNVALAVRW